MTDSPPMPQASAAPARFETDRERSRLWIEARSNVHPILGEAAGLEGEAEMALRDGELDLSVMPRARLRFRLDSLRSGNAFQDAEMHRRMEAQKFPEIEAVLRNVTPTGRPQAYLFATAITVRGVTRQVDAEVTGVVGRDGTVAIDGEFILDVREFGVSPPRILDLQVYPQVKVRVRLVLSPVAIPAADGG